MIGYCLLHKCYVSKDKINNKCIKTYKNNTKNRKCKYLILLKKELYKNEG